MWIMGVCSSSLAQIMLMMETHAYLREVQDLFTKVAVLLISSYPPPAFIERRITDPPQCKCTRALFKKLVKIFCIFKETKWRHCCC